MRHDIKVFIDGTGHHLYSDNLRLTSISHGLTLIDENPMLGVGIGDIEYEMGRYYQALNPDIPLELRTPPVNQFIFSFTAFGLVGGFLFFTFLFYPLRYHTQLRDEFVLIIYGITFGSFIGDYSIELQLGKVAFVTLATLALWRCSPLLPKS